METLPSRLGNDAHNSIETIKAESRYLRGRIAEELLDPGDHFSESSAILLRQHGIYQQFDRDRTDFIGDPGFRSEVVYQFMLRVIVPGGRLSSQQFLGIIALCDEIGNGQMKISWRQCIELHGIVKRNLVQAIRRINAMGLTTFGSCGDMNRNVVCCPAPYHGDPVHNQMHALARSIAAELAPHTSAYRDIWLAAGSSPVETAGDETVEPLYGSTYLPNKLKIAIGLPGDNCADIYVHDIGLLAICENYNVVGYNVFVGGGLEMGDDDIQPALAQPLGFVWAGQALDDVLAIVQLYRDSQVRAQRSRSRLRNLVASLGIEQFKAQVETNFGWSILPPRLDQVWNVDDHVGWHEQGDGQWFYGIHMPGGRVEDTHRGRWKSAIRDICTKYTPAIYLTTGQNILVGDIRWEDRLELEDLLRRNEVRAGNELSSARRWSGACVSMPTCPRALSESERALPGLLDELETELVRLGLPRGACSALRMSGCLHSCSRPHNADIGIIGRGAGRYAITLGGRRLGDRIGFLYRDGAPLEQIPQILAEVFGHYKNHRSAGEQFGDFCHRMGLDGLLVLISEKAPGLRPGTEVY